ncbi:hypothetical protein IJH24_02775 [Candidatus Saccharibacteria bacterium]|nr:hypothetical protein [Candidatus Saccharibacteria bacterium]
MALEINLVPDIKNEMIRTLKLRNFILFLSIIVASASVAIVFIFGVIVGGQQIAINNKKGLLETFSSKLNSYSDLNEFLTIKDQVDNITAITENKTVASRTFNILLALIPTDSPDSIEISELTVDLVSEETPTFSLEAQANAGQAPFIDYNVLDAFKKSMEYMRYDYGNYVDKEGNTIPAYCMIEKDSDGAYFYDSDKKSLYAYWNIMAEGCNTTAEKTSEEENTSEETNDKTENTDTKEESDKEITSFAGYDLEDYNDSKVVKIWRTPQFDSWYSKGYINADDGTIAGVQHFESACITYKGEKASEKSKMKWTETNDTCLLVPNGTDGINILESSNGRSASEELVLRFSAVINLAPEVFDFNNSHMIALGPSERRNVTDSYLQIQSIFGERAKDCQEGDTACSTNGGN